MGPGIISGGIIGMGIALYFKGRASHSLFHRASGITFIFAGIGLFTLAAIAKAGKMGVL